MSKFKEGDLLANKNSRKSKSVARVEMVKKGIVHCVNLVDCATMKKGAEFQFNPEVWTGFTLHSRE